MLNFAAGLLVGILVALYGAANYGDTIRELTAKVGLESIMSAPPCAAAAPVTPPPTK